MDMIYFDHAATTRVLPEAAQAAVEAMTVAYGNPSSLYALGTQAAKAVAEHRATVAQALGCRPEELYFTSCGTEGDNWAVQLAVHLGRHKGKHIITTAVEHSAVLEPCKALEMQGYEVTYLHPDATGHIRIEALEEALRPDTVLVSMLLVNNETGAIQPVAEAAQVLKQLLMRGVEKFRALFRGSRSRSEIVATFLAVLELCRVHSVRLEDGDDDLNIRFCKMPEERVEHGTDGAGTGS